MARYLGDVGCKSEEFDGPTSKPGKYDDDEYERMGPYENGSVLRGRSGRIRTVKQVGIASSILTIFHVHPICLVAMLNGKSTFG